jgi:hypothetical protein
MGSKRPGPPDRMGHLSIAIGLAGLSLMLLSLVAATRAPVAASPPVGEEPRALDSGQVITVGVAAAMSGPASFLGWPQPNAV